MNRRIRNYFNVAGSVAGLLLASHAHAGAGGLLVYGPLEHAVPALSGAMLMVMGLLIAVLAYRVLSVRAGNRLASLAALGIVGATATAGVNLIDDAYAIAPLEMSISAGGSISLPDPAGVGTYTVGNSSGIAQQIKNITWRPPCSQASAPVSTCQIGAVIASGGNCSISIECNYTP